MNTLGKGTNISGTGQTGQFGFFALNEWSKAKPDALKKELTDAVSQDPDVTDASNIGIEPMLEGGKVVAIRLNGKVKSHRESERAEQIIRVNTKDEVTVINELVVD